MNYKHKNESDPLFGFDMVQHGSVSDRYWIYMIYTIYIYIFWGGSKKGEKRVCVCTYLACNLKLKNIY